MMNIKSVEKIRNEEVRAMAGVTDVSEIIRVARQRWIGHVERKTEEDVVMITREMGV